MNLGNGLIKTSIFFNKISLVKKESQLNLCAFTSFTLLIFIRCKSKIKVLLSRLSQVKNAKTSRMAGFFRLISKSWF